jgi:hypothetical protein
MQVQTDIKGPGFKSSLTLLLSEAPATPSAALYIIES